MKEIGYILLCGFVCFGMYAMGHNDAREEYSGQYKAGVEGAKSVCLETIREKK